MNHGVLLVEISYGHIFVIFRKIKSLILYSDITDKRITHRELQVAIEPFLSIVLEISFDHTLVLFILVRNIISQIRICII